MKTDKAKEKYLKVYAITKQEEEKYEKKKYDVRMTPRDKRIAESQFSFRGNPMTIKHLFIMIIMVILVLILAGTNYEKDSKFILSAYLFLFMLLYIALMYNVNSKFYWVFFALFLVIFLVTKNFSFLYVETEMMNNKNNKNNNKKIN